MEEKLFICPKCNAFLNLKDKQYLCPNCLRSWIIKNDVIRLSDHPSYWNLIPAAEMDVFLNEVRSKGWKTAILSSKNRKVNDFYLFTHAPSRADGTFYLSLTKKSTVLDLGSGLGSYSFALSSRVKRVISADSSSEFLEFISMRAKQDDCKNISAVHIDPLDYGKLPFSDKSFDAVIMNGVLEWVGAHAKKGDPLKIQRKCLQEVNRVLKPNGEVWIGIENRFGLRYWLGATDDHLKYYSSKRVKYTSIFPRFIANFITKKTIGIPYRTYTHSFWGYRRLLRSAGFLDAEFYYPESDYRAVSTKIYPIKSKAIGRIMESNIRKGKYLKLLFSIFGQGKVLCNSYFISGRKQ